MVARFVDATRERIEAEQAAGRCAGIAPEPTAFCLAWMTERAAYQQLVQGRHDDEALVDSLVVVWRRTLYGA